MAPRNDNLNNKANELKNEEYADRHRMTIQFIHK